MNPYEQPEPPRCPYCDNLMEEKRERYGWNYFECINPSCPNNPHQEEEEEDKESEQ